MSESAAVSTPTLLPVVQFAPSDIARRRIATWNGIRTDAVEVVRREPFQAGFKAPCHLLIMCERAERDDGETLLEGLPRSRLQEFSRTLSFVPAGNLEDSCCGLARSPCVCLLSEDRECTRHKVVGIGHARA